MPEIDELSEQLDVSQNLNLKQATFQKNADFINGSIKLDASKMEKPLKSRGMFFLDSMMKSSPFIQKAVKYTAIGIALGFALALLFPPLGIVIMATSVVAGATVAGAKAVHGYANAKEKNNYNRELMEQKLTKEEIQQPEKEMDNKDSKQGIETLIENPRKEVENSIIKRRMVNDLRLPFSPMIDNNMAKNSDEVKNSIENNNSRLAMFRKPLNSLINTKSDATYSSPKQDIQQKQTQSANVRILPRL